MKEQTIAPFHCIGIAVRTSNQNNQAATDIPALWQKFMTEQVMDKIPGKTGPEIYSIYLDYEKDHTLPYTTLLACRVSSLDHIPEGMMGRTIGGGSYVKFSPKGDLDQGLVIKTWMEIWQSDLNRAYTSDYEVYGPKAQDRANAEVDIFIAVK